MEWQLVPRRGRRGGNGYKRHSSHGNGQHPHSSLAKTFLGALLGPPRSRPNRPGKRSGSGSIKTAGKGTKGKGSGKAPHDFPGGSNRIREAETRAATAERNLAEAKRQLAELQAQPGKTPRAVATTVPP